MELRNLIEDEVIYTINRLLKIEKIYAPVINAKWTLQLLL